MKGIIFFLIAVLFVSCKSTDTLNTPIVSAKLDNDGQDYLHLSHFFEIEDWIELEANANSMMSKVYKVEVTKDAIFILGNGGHRKLCKFDKEGRYICNIGMPGHGRGEYSLCYDFTIDQQTGQILMLDEGSKLNVFDKDGHFLYSKILDKVRLTRIKAFGDVIFAYNDRQILFSEADNYHVYGFNKRFEKINNWILSNEYGTVTPLSSVFQCVGEKLYYIDDIDNSVFLYNTKTEEFENYLGLEFSNPCPRDVRVNLNLFGKKIQEVDFVHNIAIGVKNAVIIYSKSGTFRISSIDLETGKVLKDGVCISYPQYLSAIDEKNVYAVYDPEYLSKSSELLIYPQKTKNKITPDSNLCIAKLRFKMFEEKRKE